MAAERDAGKTNLTPENRSDEPKSKGCVSEKKPIVQSSAEIPPFWPAISQEYLEENNAGISQVSTITGRDFKYPLKTEGLLRKVIRKLRRE